MDRVGPLRQKTPEELAAMAKQTEEHKKYRQELYRKYSLDARLADLRKSDESGVTIPTDFYDL